MKDTNLLTKDIIKLTNEFKYKSDEIHNLIERIAIWWLKNDDYLPKAVGDYKIKYVTRADKFKDFEIIHDKNNYLKTIYETETNGKYRDNMYFDLDDQIRFLKEFPVQLVDFIEKYIKAENEVLNNLDDFRKMVLNETVKKETK